MKIAFLVQWFPAMSESFILRQITWLIDQGNEVRVLAMVDPCEKAVHDDIAHYQLLDKTIYAVASPSAKFIRRIKAAGLLFLSLLRSPHRTMRLARACWQGRGRFDFPAFFLGVRCLDLSVDLIHAHFGPSGNIGLVLRKIGIAPRLITSFHGFDVTAYIRRAGRDVYRRLFEEGDCFTCNSEATRDILQDLDCPMERLVKLPMGIDIGRIPFAVRSIRPGDPIRILSVGRLVEMKGREYAIRAVARTAARYPKLEYTIVGDGPLRNPLEDMIDQLGMKGRIRILGWVSDDRLDGLYRDSHIFLHPSVVDSEGNREGQGVVLLEAQAHGLMVIATRHNAFVETVLDGKTGFLAPERDSDALAERLEFLISHLDIWPELAQAARRHAGNYDLTVLNRQLKQIYDTVISGNIRDQQMTG